MSALKGEVDRILEVIPRGSPVWYVNYPVHGNIGDLLIMLGTERFFEENRIKVVARYSMYDFPRRPRVPDGCIVVLHGGGNFGDIYEVSEVFRERVIARCHNSRVVVLPQTVYFQTQTAVDRMASVLRQHPDLHVYVRDKRSLAFLRSALPGTDVQMVPDMAHYLWPFLWDDQYDPEKPTLYLMRTDREQTVRALAALQANRYTDWPDLLSRRDRLFISNLIQLQKLTASMGMPWSSTAIWWRHLAIKLVNRAIMLYRQHGTVVTSRLHGHILASLMGHPSVLLDNSYGKNRAYFEAWTSRIAFASLGERQSETVVTAAPSKVPESAVELTVAICTRDRESDLRRCIESVAAACCHIDTGVEVLIIDDGELSVCSLERLTELVETAGARLRYYRKQPESRGLFRSRLEAVRQARGDIILFLDDDVEIFPDYLKLLLQRYRTDTALAGVGGVDELLSPPSWKGRLFARLFLLTGPKPGCLSSSGFPSPLYKWRLQVKPFMSHHLSGCNMSFRRSVLLDLYPVAWLDGYSLGEDLLLSWFARRRGPLVVDPALRVLHHVSPRSRDSGKSVAMSFVLNHLRLLQTYKAPSWRYLALGWSIMGLIFSAWLRHDKDAVNGYKEGLRRLLQCRVR